MLAQERSNSRSPSAPPPSSSNHIHNSLRKRGSLSGPALLFTSSPDSPLIDRERSSSPRTDHPVARMDLNNLPKDYLESFPYPAFVLYVPVPPPAGQDTQDADELPIPPPGHAVPFTRTSPSSTQPFDPVWANEKWRNLSQGKRLLDCINVRGARQFGDWISGARAVRGTRRASAVSERERRQFRPPPGLPLPAVLRPGADDPMSSGPPENFWEPENPPYEDRSSSSDQHSVSDTGIEDSRADQPGPMTLIMDIETPAKVTLELTKTSLPAYQVGYGGVRSRIATHTFLIITTVPRSPLVAGPPSPAAHAQRLPTAVSDLRISEPITASRSPLPRTTILDDKTPMKGVSQLPPHAVLDPSLTSAETLTPTDEIMALDLPASSASAPGRPLYFNRDGTISRPHASFPSSGRDTKGRPLDVNELLKTTDWSRTPLGPMDSWPQSLRTILSLIMAYPHQCCLWWGPELTLIYNTPYAEMLHKHPDIFGTSGPIAWAEIWNSIGPLSELVLSGTPVSKEDDFLLFKQLPEKGGGLFEEYHSWMWVPILQEDGTFGGLWNATIQTTKKVLAERRLAAVREMGERTSIARTETEFDTAVLDILTANPRDAPFAALYHVDIPVEKPILPNGNKPNVPATIIKGNMQKAQKVNLRLAGSIGIPEGHPSAPASLTVTLENRNNRDSRNLAFSGSPTMSIVSGHSGPATDDDMRPGVDSWPFREALSSRRLVLVEDCSALIQGFPIRVWDELPNAAVVVPIANDSDEGIPSTVLVIGLSIRRPFDDEYESFIHVLRLQLASGITAVRSYEAERQRIEELAALDRAKSLLFSNVSHELRTPLTLVAGPLDDMLRETPDGPKKEMLVMARRNVRRLTRLVSTLMDVSRLEAGRLKGSFRLVNLGTITRDLATLFRGAIERAKLRYVIECDMTARNTYVDLEHWEKIVFNLIGNAMKYTLHGFVHLVLSYGPHEAVLSVKDSGVGIPASDIDLIGERFHRVQSVSRSHEGTGIGLALIKELIKLHGGALEIESLTAAESVDGSHGSVFRVRIPLGFDHLPRDAIEVGSTMITNPNTTYGEGMVDEAMQWNRDREGSSIDSSSASDSGGTNGADSSNQSSRGIDPSTLYFKKEDTIMLVDDSFDTRRYMRSIFAPFCSVVEARDGLEALQLAPKVLPDLIISDVMMPNLDGFGLLNALREYKSLSMIPVIMLTARGGEEYKVEGLLAGADDYLAKPFNARELIARAHMQVQLGKRRRQLETAFEERTSELRTLSELPPAGIFRTTDDGTVTYANTAWYEMTGYPMGEEVTNWADYMHPDHRDDVVAWWQNVLASDDPVMTTEFQYSNGKWVFCKVTRLREFKFGLNGILGCVMDITERKVNEEIQRNRMLEAEQRRIEAEEAKRQQELLIDITSHEIRNPISSLMQCSSLVKTNLLALQEQLEMAISNNQGFQPTKQLLTTINEDLEALESIYQCGLAQERISNDVLSLGRIQLDMLQMFDVETDIRQEAQKVISIFQNEARMKRISLSLRLGEGIEKLGVTTIKTDPVRLGQVVTNLLSNGIRFTSTSKIRQIELKFDLSYEPPMGESCLMPRVPEYRSLKDDTPAYLYVSVTDTGPGMTPKELELLFQRFSQVSPKTHTIFGGSGLGLFVCRKITEIMGGRIEVASEQGKGSTFRFFIQVRTGPSQKRSATPSADYDMSGRPPLKKRHTGGKSGTGAAGGTKPHVLIVEDNLINQTVLMRQLKHVGLTCEVASNGLEALEKIRKVASRDVPPQGQPFDCVLMDLEMPVMDGLTALRHIREEEAAGTLSLNLVIALTGNARQGQIDEAKRAGMDEVVIKPYRLDDLLQKIEAMVLLRSQRVPGAVSPRIAKVELR